MWRLSVSPESGILFPLLASGIPVSFGPEQGPSNAELPFYVFTNVVTAAGDTQEQAESPRPAATPVRCNGSDSAYLFPRGPGDNQNG